MAPLMRLRSPGGDNAPLILPAVGVNHRNFQAVHHADRVYAPFALVEAVVGPLDGRALEDSRRIFESDSMQPEVEAILLFVPTIMHSVYLHNVNIRSEPGATASKPISKIEKDKVAAL